MILALVGPTGSGKTELGIALAERFGAEILNADSRQVYRRLDIGSAKPTPEQRARIPHHLVDVVDPDEHFDAARFEELAARAEREIAARGRRVLLVGGTGLYVRVLRRGLFAGPSRDEALRVELEREERATPGALHQRLREVDPSAAGRLHSRDLVRIIRALEVHALTGRTISDWQREHAAAGPRRSIHTVALDLPREDLYRRIDERCRRMVEAGLVDEVRHLLESGYSPDLPALQSLGYREVGDHLRGASSLAEALERTAQATRNFAKRQLTWFRGERDVVWQPPAIEALCGEMERALRGAAD